MGFVQFYFGLPLAMVVICLTFIPIYHKYKVYTAYEYLEKRFEKRVPRRHSVLVPEVWVPAYHLCPAIILSAILGWNLNYMTIAIGVLVIIYTFQGDKSGKRDPKNSKCS
jgi:Na+/proline symporter